jgi:nitrate reductase gamma subunit
MKIDGLWILALGSMAFAVLMTAVRVRSLLARIQKADLSRGKGHPGSGAVYAFTSGMSPWAKESTRKHFVSYMRGVLFHVGIFASVLILILGLLLSQGAVTVLGYVALAGFICGLGGMVERAAKKAMLNLSTPDDWFSVAIVTGMCGLAALAALQQGFAGMLYAAAALVFLYLPFSKIVHAIYFFFSRYYFGRHFGHRGVFGTRFPREDMGSAGESPAAREASHKEKQIQKVG